CKQVLQTPHSF
nr:immunoglobulin light chain junction region [Macaca mulatta]